jgi:hypothetical protein
MSDRETQIDDIDRIREGIQAELDGSWGFDSLQRLDRLTADAANVAEESPDEAGPLADPLAELLSRTVDEEYSTAGEMIGKENLLRSVKQQTASSLAEIASESPMHVVPVITELTRVAIREDDEDVRDELETVFDSVAGEDHDAVCEAVAVLEGVLDHGDVGDRSRAVETVGWIGYRDSAAVADLVDPLQSLVDEPNVRLSKRVLYSLGRIVDDPSYQEDTATPESTIMFGATAGTYLSNNSTEICVSAASFLNSVSQKDPSVIREFFPELVDLSIESEQAHYDATKSLSLVAVDCPEAITEVKPRLRAGLTSDNPDTRERSADIIAETTRGLDLLDPDWVEDPDGVNKGAIVGAVVDFVPELIDILIESEQGARVAGSALSNITESYPEAIAEAKPRLRVGLTSDDPNLQEQTAKIIKKTAGGDPGAVVDLVPELADLLIESEQVRSDVGDALKQIGTECPEAIAEVTSRLRVGLTSDDPDLQEQTAKIIKKTAGGDPGVVVDFVPELIDILIESEQVRSDVLDALERIVFEYPEAITEVTPQLRAGLTSNNLDVQAYTIEVIKTPIGTDTSVVVDLVPELIDVLIELEGQTGIKKSPGPTEGWGFNLIENESFKHGRSRPDADGVLERIGFEFPEAIAEITSRLRVGLTSDDPDVQARTARIIKKTASSDPSAVAELIPELTDVLVESEEAESDAREALTHVVTYRPKSVKTALSERVDDLRSCDTDIQTQVTKLIRFGAETHPNVFLDFSPELTTLLGDETYEIRKNAALTLIYISEGNLTDLAEHRSQFRELIMHEETTHEIKIVLVDVLCRLGSETIIDPMMD